jgi:hypothetical protein
MKTISDERFSSGKSAYRNARRINIENANKNVKPDFFYPVYDTYENDEDKQKNSVAFLIVATGKYDIYVKNLIESIEEFVLLNNKHYYIFTDKDIVLDINNYSIIKIEHRPFPYPTLYRFHFFLDAIESIKNDQLVYIDADTLIKNPIGTEILTPRTTTQHCGFLNRKGTFETRTNSSCYINPNDSKNYYGGGFYSFSREEFIEMSKFCKEVIDRDAINGIVPIWHDESALNKYMTLVEPTRVLSPSYHYPVNKDIIKTWERNFECKILLLDKNHKDIRS